ncbi:MAG: leucyl aminopeptidase [Rhodocyclaceae bacterium]|nr:leucyl aminopeptidase [Rhodocyclaceae bacterium]
MKFDVKAGDLRTRKTDCLAIGVFAEGTLSDEAKAIDDASRGAIKALIREGDFGGDIDSCHMLHSLDGIAANRLLLIGLGSQEKYSAQSFRRGVSSAVKRMGHSGSSDLTLSLPTPDKEDARSLARCLATAAHEALYRFDGLKSGDKVTPKLKQIVMLLADPERVTLATHGLSEGTAIGEGADLARDLGNLPANICTPTYLADQAKKLALESKLDVQVLDRKQMQALGMNTLLSVAAGSDEPPKFIVLKHLKGNAKDAPIVLVGKGITFDTGGISLKPGAAMDEMKYDMCGAASVIGTMQTVARLRLPINVIGVVPTTENMPSGKATRPGDIVKSMSGQTVEILNTDAEGRLILCDALTYVERFKPACVIDVATLTGACVIALGSVGSGLLANDDELAQEVLAAGLSSGDRAWQLPLWDEYQDQLKSNFADMANIGGRAAGTITAASFLARFTKQYRWAHLDIAGTAWRSGKDKGSTGRPVPLLSHFLIARAGEPAAPPKSVRKAKPRRSR